MKRFIHLLFFVSTALAVSAQMFDLAQPQQLKWFGDQNWSLSGSYNNQSAGTIGTPYALVPDIGTSGTIKYQFTAGIGGGYRADQIVWWAKRKQSVYYAYLVYQTLSMGIHFDQEMFESREAALAALEKWNAAIVVDVTLDGGIVFYNSNVQTIAYDQVAVTGSPSGVPSPSEVKNDFTKRGWLNTGEVSYNPSLYGGQELRASFWTFQRTAGNEQKMEMQDRGPWILPPALLGKPEISLELKKDDVVHSVSVSPSTQTIELGQSADLLLAALGAAYGDNSLSGEGIPSSVPLNGIVKARPTTVGVNKYTYTVSGEVVLTWKTDDASATLTLSGPAGLIDVTAPPRYRAVAEAGDYTLTAVNSSGSTTSPPVHVEISKISSTAYIVVNSSVGPDPVFVQSDVALLTSDYTPSEGPHASRSYHRSWQEGSRWNAYLGRDGIKIQVTGTSTSEGIAQLELQAKSPMGDWFDLAPSGSADSSVSNGGGASASKMFSVRLGEVRSDKPLIPSDPSLAGEWQLRGRAQTTGGLWSEWSATRYLNVLMPAITQSFSAQTLPPADASGKWFSASAVKTYSVQELIP